MSDAWMNITLCQQSVWWLLAFVNPRWLVVYSRAIMLQRSWFNWPTYLTYMWVFDPEGQIMDLSDDSYNFWIAILSARPRHVRLSLPNFHENRWHWSCSHWFTGLVPVHNIFFIVFLHNKRICFKIYLSTLHPTTAFGVQKWQLTLHSQDPGSNAVVSLPTFREQSSTF